MSQAKKNGIHSYQFYRPEIKLAQRNTNPSSMACGSRWNGTN
jgi:hypothetical protein